MTRNNFICGCCCSCVVNFISNRIHVYNMDVQLCNDDVVNVYIAIKVSSNYLEYERKFFLIFLGTRYYARLWLCWRIKNSNKKRSSNVRILIKARLSMLEKSIC
jgi:hypothetical protein